MVTITATNSLYAYNGDLATLLNLSVLPSIGSPVSGTITDGDGVINGSSTDATVNFANDGLGELPLTFIGYGTASGLLNQTRFMAFSVGNQIYFYAPQGFPIAAGVIVSFSVNPNSAYAITPGAVDGTGGNDSMPVGYTDPQGDRITNGNDTILGNAGNDTIRAGGGDDLVYGGNGADSIFGEGGNDTIYGEAGNDYISGGAGNDLIYGGAGNDSLYGNAGSDTIYGGSGDDLISGGTEDNSADLLFGGAGNDTFLGAGGNDTIDGGAGRDTFVASAMPGAITVTVDDSGNGIITSGGFTTTLISVENYVAAEVAGQIDTITLTTSISNVGSITGIDDGAQNGLTTGTFTLPDGTVIAFGGAGQPSYDQIIADVQGGLYYAGGTLSITGGDESGQVGNISFSNFERINITITCFTRGTLIDTAFGPKRIELLRKGDLVRTMDRGLRPIRWIGRSRVSPEELARNPKLRPIVIRSGALGQGLPNADLRVSRQHRLLVSSKIAERMIGSRDVLMPAVKLTQIDNIDVDDYCEDVEYVHMLFDQHEIVFSNGAPSESLFTGPEALKSVPTEAASEIRALFPEIAEAGYTPTPVREIPTGQQMKQLAGRHRKNRKPLLELLS